MVAKAGIYSIKTIGIHLNQPLNAMSMTGWTTSFSTILSDPDLPVLLGESK